jgi:hypothetical protein
MEDLREHVARFQVKPAQPGVLVQVMPHQPRVVRDKFISSGPLTWPMNSNSQAPAVRQEAISEWHEVYTGILKNTSAAFNIPLRDTISPCSSHQVALFKSIA